MSALPKTLTIKKSLIVPVFCNEDNIEDLVEALNCLHQDCEGLEVVFVIDGSPDRSGEFILSRRGSMHFCSQIVYHSRNFGSFTAIRTGMEFARGELIAVMAADLQEPPELIKSMFKILESDSADIVFGNRIKRHDSLISDFFSSVFWWVYRKLVINAIPPGGVDIFACNLRVSQAILEISEPNSSLVVQLFWVGFRRSFVKYDRRPREKGKSSWSFNKKIQYMMDSIFSFSDLPILFILWIGFAGCVTSLSFGLFVGIARLLKFVDVPGYAGMVLLMTFGFSTVLLVQGVFGIYIWRTFENTKSRPLRIVRRRIFLD